MFPGFVQFTTKRRSDPLHQSFFFTHPMLADIISANQTHSGSKFLLSYGNISQNKCYSDKAEKK